MRKIDCYEQDLDTTVVLADFSATLDLRTRQAGDCSVDNHAVLDVCCVLNNFRNVRLVSNEHACIRDAAMFCCFGCSASSGEK